MILRIPMDRTDWTDGKTVMRNDTEFTVNLQLLNDAEYVVKNHAKRVGPVLITPFDICIILHLLEKPN